MYISLLEHGLLNCSVCVDCLRCHANERQINACHHYRHQQSALDIWRVSRWSATPQLLPPASTNWTLHTAQKLMRLNVRAVNHFEWNGIQVFGWGVMCGQLTTTSILLDKPWMGLFLHMLTCPHTQQCHPIGCSWNGSNAIMYGLGHKMVRSPSIPDMQKVFFICVLGMLRACRHAQHFHI